MRFFWGGDTGGRGAGWAGVFCVADTEDSRGDRGREKWDTRGGRLASICDPLDPPGRPRLRWWCLLRSEV